ncbi:hypothetical protein Ddye_010937 [Dipteronia dyeriana]|uniref:Uncharacterized protein n=1 Tax=Dipteronia dyeriana TaxID=168575 RepID=A0AAD9XE73_9ROSI|nr:hypothetical protein Ddye_010937 [Dipteronia dyeriana]
MKTNSIQLIKETTKRKLEDYLDPVLLRAISSEIGGRMKKNHEISKSKRREIKDNFEWPIDELKVLVGDSRTEKRNNEAAINVDDDIHLSQIQEVDADDGVGDREGVFCAPFQRFEHTALRKFNG